MTHRRLKAFSMGLTLAAPLFLMGCETAADRAAEQARLDAIDSKNCTDLGFKQGTEAYGNCMLKMRELRAESKGSGSNIHYGVGLGIGIGL
ncbi:MAG: hypothetical protein GC184_15220 [Rhizobiales bacterium]|nr:hypothetical protein [Hyphomicrobiales bacterium]